MNIVLWMCVVCLLAVAVCLTRVFWCMSDASDACDSLRGSLSRELTSAREDLKEQIELENAKLRSDIASGMVTLSKGGDERAPYSRTQLEEEVDSRLEESGEDVNRESVRLASRMICQVLGEMSPASLFAQVCKLRNS